MRRFLDRLPQMFWLLPVSVALLLAADPSWKNKPVPDWTAADVRQILTDSPGQSMSRQAWLAGRARTSAEKEGTWGSPPASGTTVWAPRWETALPVRVAELQANEIDPPTLEGDGYKVAVYGIPEGVYKADPLKPGDPLKALAMLRRESKPDVKPLRVAVFQRRDGLAVVYLFPLSAEISKTDTYVEFDAQIGRVIVRQLFSIADMQFHGSLKL